MAIIVRYALREQTAWDNMTPAEQLVYSGHFTSLTAWQTARARDLVAADEIEQLEVFDDWPSGYWEGSVFSFNSSWGTSADAYICICAAPGHESKGSETSGARFIRPNSGTSWESVFGPSPSEELVIHWYDISIINLEPSGIISGFPDENAVYKRCLCKAEYTTFQYPGNHTFYSCILIVEEYGILDASWNNPTNKFYNSVLKATTPNSVGISGSNGTDIAINTIFIGFTTDTSGTLSASSSNNATTNAAATDPSISIISIDPAVEFIDNAANDFHLISTSSLIAAGQNLYDAANLQYDIDNEQYPQVGAWPVGIDYLVTDTVPPDLSNPTATNIQETSVVLGAATNEDNGIAHAIIVPAGEQSIPTNQEVIDGTYGNIVASGIDLLIQNVGVFSFQIISGLAQNTPYGYVIVHEDAAGNEDLGSRVDGTFTTLAPQVGISISIKDMYTLLGIPGATVLLEARTGGPLSAGTQILLEITDSQGDVSISTGYTGDQPYRAKARKGTISPFYKEAIDVGTITSNGLNTTILLTLDE